MRNGFRILAWLCFSITLVASQQCIGNYDPTSGCTTCLSGFSGTNCTNLAPYDYYSYTITNLAGNSNYGITVSPLTQYVYIVEYQQVYVMMNLNPVTIQTGATPLTGSCSTEAVGLTVSALGDVYTSCYNSDFLKWVNGTGTPVVISASGCGLAFQIAIDQYNNMYTGCQAQQVMMVYPNGGIGTPFALIGTCVSYGFAISPLTGDLIASCSDSNLVQRWKDPYNGTIPGQFLYGSCDTGGAQGLAIGANGDVYVDCGGLSSIFKYSYLISNGSYAYPQILTGNCMTGTSAYGEIAFQAGVGLFVSCANSGTVMYWPQNGMGTIPTSQTPTVLANIGGSPNGIAVNFNGQLVFASAADSLLVSMAANSSVVLDYCDASPALYGPDCQYNFVNVDCTPYSCPSGYCVALNRTSYGVPNFQCLFECPLPDYIGSTNTTCVYNPCAFSLASNSLGYTFCGPSNFECISTPLSSGGGYNCSCATGYSGSNCTTWSPCASPSPCANGATCIPNPTPGGSPSFTCTCSVGYTGTECQYWDPCQYYLGDSCFHGGACVNNTTPGGIPAFTCNCTAGYVGSSCSTYNPCQYNNITCENGGTCNDYAGDETSCSCAGAYVGEFCMEWDACGFYGASNLCFNGAACISGNNSTQNFTCNCTTGFIGSQCSVWNPCSENDPCNNGGTCVNNNTPGDTPYTFCVCPLGYIGNNCSTWDPCTYFGQPCKHGGECVDNSTHDGLPVYLCTCAAGFIGTNCSLWDPCLYYSEPCANGGSCVDNETVGGSPGFQCTCASGYTGQNCTLWDPCVVDNPCEHGGNCTNNATVGGVPASMCTCPAGYLDDTCGVYTPCTYYNISCEHNGTCSTDLSAPDGWVCNCAPGYTNTTCQTHTISSTTTATPVPYGPVWTENDNIITGVVAGVGGALILAAVTYVVYIYTSSPVLYTRPTEITSSGSGATEARWTTSLD